MPSKIDKAAVLYLHKRGTDYQCRDCSMFIAEDNRCSIHGLHDVIHAYGSCGFFVLGDPMPDMHPMGHVMTRESGYTEHQAGFSCKRCANFLMTERDCLVVDKGSDGDDPNIIHPDGCCNAWISQESSPTSRLRRSTT